MPESVVTELLLRGVGLMGLLAVAWWFAKKRLPKTINRAGLRVASKTGLSKGSVVAVVEVENRTFLVGATDHQITLLSELESTHETDELTDEPMSPTSRPRMDLVRNLQRMTLRRPNHRKPQSGIRS